MGCHIPVELAHYRGPIRDGDYILIASNNLSMELNHRYTREPYYLSRLENISNRLLLESITSIRSNESKNNYYNLPIFQIGFKLGGFYLRLVSENYKSNKLLNNTMKNTNEPIYLSIDSISSHIILDQKQFLFNAIGIPNIKNPINWSTTSILSDVGYIIQELYSGLSVNWDHLIDNKDSVSYNKIRFIPVNGYYPGFTGDIEYDVPNDRRCVALKYIYNPICQEDIKKVIDNDVNWFNNIFKGDGVDYIFLYTDIEECRMNNKYEYCTSDYNYGCRGPLPPSIKSIELNTCEHTYPQNSCYYLDGTYKYCWSDNEFIDIIKQVDNKSKLLSILDEINPYSNINNLILCVFVLIILLIAQYYFINP